MGFITFFVGAAALFSSFASALPRPDSAINEPPVSAPDGTPITLTSTPVAQATSASGSHSPGNRDSSGPKNSGYGSSGYSSGSGGSSGSSSSSSMVWLTSTDLSTSTSSAWQSYSTPSHGSGSSNWDNQPYNNCVQQCIASYGMPSAAYTPTATNTPAASNTGTGTTHTVIVAPTQGVLRYIPFAVNASVGDTIKFMWGANNHTVTKSSALLPCNKSSDALFTSGTQNKDFVFTQVVNDTNPTFFYCGTPGHCEKGMFGIINPPNAFQTTSTVSKMLPSIAANNSDVMAYATYTEAQTGKTPAGKWGNNIDLGGLPDWSHQYVAENVMYTRNFLAANPEVLTDGGSVDLSAAGATPLMIPGDLSAAISNAGSSSTSSPVVAPSAAVTYGTPAPSSTASGLNSGAIPMSSPKVTIGLVAALAVVLMM